MRLDQIRDIIKEKGLKITPQRTAVLEAVLELGNHPTAERIIDFIQKNHPNVAIGTVYKTLETFVEKKIIKKVKTEKDIMRYDAILEKHHHLYCAKSDRIEDYYDNDLNDVLEEYFKKKNIDNFKIEDVKLQIIGNFIKN
jgi:Fur family peroxide stress response transcriptional regulator